ncbi:MAG: glycerophosphodiester phosphodiesterase [Bradymonadales bacterium]|nr:glycerophosphodiester phosphodiesterase [Bradymonadales bacterium]
MMETADPYDAYLETSGSRPRSLGAFWSQRWPPDKKDRYRSLVIAHRGASGLVPVGNTMEAFEKAIELGADMIELDVRRTADGVLVVFHDPDIAGIRLADMSYAELLQHTAKLGFEVPRLVDVVNNVKERIALDIEIKETGYEAELVRLLGMHLDPSNFVVTSFLDSSVSAIRQIDPAIDAGLLLGTKLTWGTLRQVISEWWPKARLCQTGATFVAAHHRLCRLGFSRRMTRLGLPLLVWTVNQEVAIRHFIRCRVAGIITDRPDLALIPALDSRSRLSV